MRPFSSEAQQYLAVHKKPSNEELASDDDDQFLPDDGEELDGNVLHETW
jgi:hypothetical protein